jgi:hypothetical protein
MWISRGKIMNEKRTNCGNCPHWERKNVSIGKCNAKKKDTTETSICRTHPKMI